MRSELRRVSATLGSEGKQHMQQRPQYDDLPRAECLLPALPWPTVQRWLAVPVSILRGYEGRISGLLDGKWRLLSGDAHKSATRLRDSVPDKPLRPGILHQRGRVLEWCMLAKVRRVCH